MIRYLRESDTAQLAFASTSSLLGSGLYQRREKEIIVLATPNSNSDPLTVFKPALTTAILDKYAVAVQKHPRQ